MRLYALSCPCVFYCDPAESGGVIVLWSIVWDRYACIPHIYNYICVFVGVFLKLQSACCNDKDIPLCFETFSR